MVRSPLPGGCPLAPRTRVFAATTVVFVVLDQLTKALVRRHVPEGRGEIPVVPGLLSLVHSENPGAAFGLGHQLDPTLRAWLFGVFTVVALVVLVRVLRDLAPGDLLQATAVGLVTSGAVGNAIDRLLRGTVTDFVRVHVADPDVVASLRGWPLVGPLFCGARSCDWPAFNVADVAIVGGLGLFGLVLLRAERAAPAASPTADAGP